MTDLSAHHVPPFRRDAALRLVRRVLSRLRADPGPRPEPRPRQRFDDPSVRVLLLSLGHRPAR
ncbi:hypothetical protein HKCCE2091_15265 [Rhodobacterales bacterium HKCCE2091]|nr:hypothetical protein [Rhodobacterales bacterium HKCCE2091]